MHTIDYDDMYVEFTDAELIEEHHSFCSFVDFYDLDNCDMLQEGVIDALKSVPGKLKRHVEFIKELSDKLKISITELFKIFKDRVVFRFFKMIGWSIVKLIRLIKNGQTAYASVRKAIAEFIHMKGGRVTKWTDDMIKELDMFLAKHPATKKIGGIVLGGLIVYIWMTMAFTGDIQFDFDQTTLFSALSGSIGFADIFAGAQGIELLTLFAIGALGGGVPWLATYKATTKLVISIVGTLLIASGKRKVYDDLMKTIGVSTPKDIKL